MNGNKQSVKREVSAKVNLSLRVVGVVDNGYHLLDSVVMSMPHIFDVVTLSKREDDNITCRIEFMPNIVEIHEIPHEQNSAVKAAKFLMDEFGLSGFDIVIEKGIPCMAGLGGSSADAAGVILGVCEMFAIDKDDARICAIADKCGADVRMQMSVGIKRVRGFGEKIEFVDEVAPLYIIVAMGKGSVSTPECYKMVDEICGCKFTDNDDNAGLVDALRKGDLARASEFMVNDMQAAAVSLNPDIANTLELLRQTGAVAVSMTGSGAACFAIFDEEDKYNSTLSLLRDQQSLTLLL